MGLAASQGRYLCLTARMSDLIYEGQQISQQRLALSKETQDIAKKYNDAMNNTKMEVSVVEGGTQRLNYNILTSQDPFSGLCMRLVDTQGNVVIPGKNSSLEATYTDEEGNSVTSSFYSASSFIQKFMATDEHSNEMANWSLDKIKEYYEENYSSSGVTLNFTEDKYSYLKKADERYILDENINDSEYLEEMIKSGQYVLQQATTDTDSWEELSWQGSTQINEVYDTSDDAAAKAEYESATTELQRRDKILELSLEQIQTQERAVEKEIDSVKEVIKSNIEESYKTFA